MKIISIGSINIDDVYTVPHIVQPGETIGSTQFQVFPGGKGANQSVALARAGANTIHFGKIGKDGIWVKDLMESSRVDVKHIHVSLDIPTGKAIIQVSNGENAIILYPGTNHAITLNELDEFFDSVAQTDWVLLQNELNSDATAYAIDLAFEKGCIVCFNPAPCNQGIVQTIPIENVHILIVNDIESLQIAQEFQLENTVDPKIRLNLIMNRLPLLKVAVITLGKEGAIAAFRSPDEILFVHEPIKKVNVVDTTGAGDTFIGYFLATLSKSTLSIDTVQYSLEMAVKASGICCQVQGAMPSIPTMDQLQ